MIDPIRDSVYQDYQRQKQSKKIDGSNTEKGKFNLDYADEGVLYEPSSEKDDKTDEAAKKQAGSFQAAAALELKELTETNPSSYRKAASAEPSFTEVLRTFLARARQFLRELWTAIWETPSAKENAAVLTKEELDEALPKDENISDRTEPLDDAAVTDHAADSNTVSGNTAGGNTAAQDKLHAANDARILHALKSGDRNHFRSLLSEDGRRTPARNSSLLTYYDAKGNLISPDASVQQRVLHGDRGSMKR
ncbi:MAG: hypothetical protein HDQ98_06800 [Lachnospiraceae bacterium]|nr:hypothetical protein [Lachnospiraceae bacterium]